MIFKCFELVNYDELPIYIYIYILFTQAQSFYQLWAAALPWNIIYVWEGRGLGAQGALFYPSVTQARYS